MVCKAVLFCSVVVVLCRFSTGKYTDCGSEDGSLKDVVVSNCKPDAKRCTLKRNTNASMEISFTPSTASDSLTAVVHGIVLGVPVPFDLPNPDGCKDSGVSCPLQPGTSYKYTTQMPILSSYPRVTVDIKWQLLDAAGKDVICALIPAKIN